MYIKAKRQNQARFIYYQLINLSTYLSFISIIMCHVSIILPLSTYLSCIYLSINLSIGKLYTYISII